MKKVRKKRPPATPGLSASDFPPLSGSMSPSTFSTTSPSVSPIQHKVLRANGRSPMKPQGVINAVSKALNERGIERPADTASLLSAIPAKPQPVSVSELVSEIETRLSESRNTVPFNIENASNESASETTDALPNQLDPVRIGLVKSAGSSRVLEEAQRQGLDLSSGTDVDTFTRLSRATAADAGALDFGEDAEEENDNVFKAYGTKTAKRNITTRKRYFSGPKY